MGVVGGREGCIGEGRGGVEEEGEIGGGSMGGGCVVGESWARNKGKLLGLGEGGEV